MNADLMISLGLVLMAGAFFAILNAFTHGRGIRMPALLLLGGLAMIATGVSDMPQGFDMADLSGAVSRTVDRYLN